MTDDEIRNMPAGREMDALVAERVMGWHKEETGIMPRWADKDGHFVHYVLDDFDGNSGWFPSDDIAAAWEVVEKMNEKFTVEIWREDGDWHCSIAGVVAHAPAAPHVICRTAYLAVNHGN